MRQLLRLAPLASALILGTVLAAGCGGTIPGTSAGQSAAGDDTGRCGSWSAVVSHQAPEVEELLPEEVAGRQLSRWSVVGRCWLEMSINDDAAIESLLAGVVGLDLDHLRYAVAGRSDTTRDPPYFVFAAARPESPDEADLAAFLILGAAGFDDPLSAMALDGFEPRTIDGKTVFVGSSSMLTQSEHQRGNPYLYQTDEYLFALITDDESWALEALLRLP